jgi:predicted Zn-ribbon and HTH transcriptional regulator
MLPACRKRAAGEQTKPRWEVAHVFRLYGEAYRRSHALPRSHLKVMQAIEVCRTAYLGGHIEQCDSCGFQRQAYNSCRNRHCPKCQSLAKAQWLQQRKAELLPVGYFHLVFTLPHELNPIALRNKKVLCTILFQAVSQTLLEFARTHLGGTLGFIAVLHTWDQTLRDHFHLHCLIPAGALSLDRSRWIPARSNFLFPVKALSSVFRGKFLHWLRQAFCRGQLQFPGQTASLAQPDAFARLLQSTRQKKWVVYAKRPFSSPEKVLHYLGRYTHRVALSNHRIVSVQDGQVTFLYRDRKNGDQLKSTTLPADEFIRRFLLHVLPDRFMRIRHFGFLANRSKKQNLSRCRQILGLSPALPPPSDKTIRQQLLELTGIDWFQCPCCKKGTMIVIAQLPNASSSPFLTSPIPHRLDSS